MRAVLILPIALLAMAGLARTVSAHGFPLTLSGDQTTVSYTSQSPVLDLSGHPIQYSFVDVWGGAPLSSDEGFATTDASFPTGTTFTFNLTSPVMFSSGGAAVPASASTYIEIYDRFPGPTGSFVASSATIDLYGSSALGVPGFQVNGDNPHELEKTLNNPGANGVYGFGFTFTAQLPSGASITSGPFADVFETPGFTSASALIQQQAEIAVVTAVPEPSSLALGLGGLIGLCLMFRRNWRRSHFSA